MTLKPLKYTLALTLGLGLFVGATHAAKQKPDLSKLPPASDRKGLTYEKDIRPVFEKNCMDCHGPQKHKGGLQLGSLEAALKGGADGKVIIPGDSARSMLLHNIAQIGDKADFMPPAPRGKQLSAEEIGLVRAWIDQGAK